MTEKENPGLPAGVQEEDLTQSNLPSNPEPRQPEFHPAADVFPLVTGAEFDELVADIKANGLLQPIALLGGQILDGRNRYRACAEAGVKPTYVDVAPADPVVFVISANIRRRHLNSEQKRELVAKLLQANPTKSDRQIATSTGVSHPTVGAVREELEANRKIFPVEKTVGADGKARKPKKTPEQKVAVRAAKTAKRSEKKKQQVAQLEELERENSRLRGENTGLRRQVADLQGELRQLKSALALVESKPFNADDDAGEEIPEFLRREPQQQETTETDGIPAA